MEDKVLNNKPCIESDANCQDFGNEEMYLIIDENGTVKSIEYKKDDVIKEQL